ncbi:hypothetical protein M2139_001838 [Enterococcus sp. PF1-24]|uniref:hypothetical protein n=1 Tax=unclassified Enterococcus TaxID=2608891 RepID=UPI002475D7CC|nr:MULTISPECIES: hypothetical protein [unclassified Enterococcus]MDH6364838.1 hypothetical protein [Enterococcus sp. PFB1-1]MDH6401938.1 hypothetical protein [Enterococcus sp. PF1-24]
MKNYKTIATLSLVNAIIGTILSIPGLSAMFSFGGATTLATLIIAIVILVMGKGDQKVRKTSSILMIVASVIAGIIILASVTVLLGSLGVSASSFDSLNSASYIEDVLSTTGVGGMVSGAIGIVIAGVVSWIIRVVATIFYYIDYSKLSKLD